MNETTRTEAAAAALRMPVGKSPSVVGVFLWALVAVGMGFGAPAHAGLKVYYVRHAEYGGNVVNQWKDKPKEQWPAYVGRGDMFTPKGEEQVQALTEKLLKNYHF